jgi:hypothetical protein
VSQEPAWCARCLAQLARRRRMRPSSLVVGIDDYIGIGTENDLDGAVNDAKDVAQ